ncbi:hypothetical protein D3C81_1511910 [compost metagenome]
MRSQCSPIDNPVRGSPLRGSSGFRWPGRNCTKGFNRSPRVLPRLACSKMRRSPSLTPIGASDVVSTPPAIPLSICPRAILLATSRAASSPVPQAC